MLAILGQNPKCIYYNAYVYHNGYIIYFNRYIYIYIYFSKHIHIIFVYHVSYARSVVCFLHANAFSEGPWPPKGGHRNTSQYPMKDAIIHGLF